MRRTPLERRTPLRRSGRIRSVSVRRLAERAARDEVREEVFERDGQRCLLEGRGLLGPCGGRLTAHHLVKAWKRPPYRLPYLVTLCVLHNERVEDRPLEAHGLGLVVWEGETLSLAWDRLRAGDLVP